MAGENDEPAEPVDRPQDLPRIQSAVDIKEARKRKTAKDIEARRRGEWFSKQMQDPLFREFAWSVLEACGTFRETYSSGPNGFPHSELTWAERGAKDTGQRIYHTWLIRDPEGVLAMLHEFHPLFPKKDGQ